MNRSFSLGLGLGHGGARALAVSAALALAAMGCTASDDTSAGSGADGGSGGSGSVGATGPMGAMGAAGATGATGAAGMNGTAGATGADGAVGATGAEGATGPAGPGAEITAGVIAVFPAQSYVGRTVDVTIVGLLTHFVTGTEVSFGAGIEVNSLRIATESSLVANITLTADATEGGHSLTVTVPGAEGAAATTFTLENAFTVLGSLLEVEVLAGRVAPGGLVVLDVTTSAADNLFFAGFTIPGGLFNPEYNFAAGTFDLGAGVVVQEVEVDDGVTMPFALMQTPLRVQLFLQIDPMAAPGPRALVFTNASGTADALAAALDVEDVDPLVLEPGVPDDTEDISTNLDHDLWVVSASKGDVIDIALIGNDPEFAPGIIVWGAGWDTWQNPLIDIGATSTSFTAPADGDYLVRIDYVGDAPEEELFLGYVITADVTSPTLVADESEPNDELGEATELFAISESSSFAAAVPLVAFGRLEEHAPVVSGDDPTPDVDLYAFELGVGEVVILAAQTGPASFDSTLVFGDTRVRILDGEGNELAVSDDANGSGWSNATTFIGLPGWYYVEVTLGEAAMELGDTGSYSLMVSATQVDVERFAAEDTPQTIPDEDYDGVYSMITLPPCLVEEIYVELNITHAYIGDIGALLEGPDGTVVLLKDLDTGGSANDLHAIYDVTSMSEDGSVSDFVGTIGTGEWTLNVIDGYGGDVGTLDSWALLVRCGEPPVEEQDGGTDGGVTDGGDMTDGGMTDGGMTDGGMTDGGM